MHALIVGANGTGKTTLIHRVLQTLLRPVSGFETVKEDVLADGIHGSPIHIYEIGNPHHPSPENLVGYCRDKKAVPICDGFERFAGQFSPQIVSGSIIVMDEIGFLESQSPLFCQMILSLLDGSIPIIAAVRDKDRPFLNTVRSHPQAHCFFLTLENREAVFREVLEFMNSQLEEFP